MELSNFWIWSSHGTYGNMAGTLLNFALEDWAFRTDHCQLRRHRTVTAPRVNRGDERFGAEALSSFFPTAFLLFPISARYTPSRTFAFFPSLLGRTHSRRCHWY